MPRKKNKKNTNGKIFNTYEEFEQYFFPNHEPNLLITKEDIDAHSLGAKLASESIEEIKKILK